jgi:hypothetical protein
MNGVVEKPNPPEALRGATLLPALPHYQFNQLKCWLEKGKELQPAENQIVLLENEFSQTEYQVARIFADVLGLKQFSLKDDFFKIGGNSILAMKAFPLIKEKFSVEITVREFFMDTTVRSISELLLTKAMAEDCVL